MSHSVEEPVWTVESNVADTQTVETPKPLKDSLLLNFQSRLLFFELLPACGCVR